MNLWQVILGAVIWATAFKLAEHYKLLWLVVISVLALVAAIAFVMRYGVPISSGKESISPGEKEKENPPLFV